jgi:hypothetical protein
MARVDSRPASGAIYVGVLGSMSVSESTEAARQMEVAAARILRANCRDDGTSHFEADNRSPSPEQITRRWSCEAEHLRFVIDSEIDLSDHTPQRVDQMILSFAQESQACQPHRRRVRP